MAKKQKKIITTLFSISVIFLLSACQTNTEKKSS